MKRLWALVIWSVVVWGGASPAHAIPIVTPTVTDLGGLFEYHYVVSNSADSTEELFDFSLFDFPAEPLDVQAPAGWDVISFWDAGLGVGFIDWFFIEPVGGIAAGASQDGFRFQSLLGPGEVMYAVLGTDLLTGETSEPYLGTVLGPAVSTARVPEPATWLLVGVGTAALGLLGRARRRFDA